MGSEENQQLHIFLFPFMAHGHMIPMVDMAKLFTSQGVKITIVTTPVNSVFISKSIEKVKTLSSELIELLILKFPASEVGLPDGCENTDFISSFDMLPSFFKAMSLLQDPLEKALMEAHPHPHCLVADIFFPWANDVASKVGIPRLIFHGTSFFSLCASELMRLHEPFKQVLSDSEPFIIPHLPGEIMITKMQLPDFIRENVKNEFSEFLIKVRESESECFGTVVNSFYELEGDYADCYRNVLGRKAWHIGPLSLRNNDVGNNVENDVESVQIRGKESAIDEHECLKWLNSKAPNSVVYICFGSLAKFNSDQLKEIANGLEASGRQFIWVVRKGKEDGNDEDWLPQAFEERMEGKGLIIRGWAPQVLILDHEAIGGFVTHCGWNSTLEGVTAGVPMVTWPVAAEQFYNEKLVTLVLKIGVPVGVEKWVRTVGDFIKREAIEKAITRIMVGEEAEEIRSRAREYAEKARKALAEDGSSSSDLNALIKELKSSAF